MEIDSAKNAIIPQATIDNRSIKILIAEDNDYNALVANDTLLKYFPNALISRVSNGEEALSFIGKNECEIVLMDVQMPLLDGYEATRRLRKMGHQLPILALTASVIRTDLDKCIEAGMDGYLAKPFRDEDLISGISSVLSQKEVRLAERSERIDKTEKFKSLFLKVVPERLKQLKDTLSEGNVQEVKRLIHLMRPQLQSSGIALSDSDFDNIEHFSSNTATDEFNRMTETIIEAVKVQLESMQL